MQPDQKPTPDEDKRFVSMIDRAALEVAAQRIYEDKGDRIGKLYAGWDAEPDTVKADWIKDCEVAVQAYLAAQRPASDGWRQSVLAVCKEMSTKYGNPNGTDYEQGAQDMAARIYGAVAIMLDPATDTGASLPCKSNSVASHEAPDLIGKTAEVERLREVLSGARETILQLKNARWSEAEGTDAEWVSDIDAALNGRAAS